VSEAREEGENLIVRAGARLPNVCVKCGALRGLVRMPWTLEHRPGMSAYMPIAGMVLRRTAKIEVACCGPCRARWIGAVALSTLGLPISIAGMIMIIVGGPWLLRGVLVLVAAGIVVRLIRYSTRHRMVHARKIDGAFVTIAGIAPAARRAAVGQ
jgi:hypothetical protein